MVFESDSPSSSSSRVSSPVLCLSLMKVGSLDHDGEREGGRERERERERAAHTSTSHGCIYREREREREREAQRVMRMAARKLLQHDGTWRHRGTGFSTNISGTGDGKRQAFYGWGFLAGTGTGELSSPSKVAPSSEPGQ